MSAYVLRPRPPRLLAVAALLILAAACLLGVGLGWHQHRFGLWLAATCVGVVGLALIAVALVALRRRRIHVELDSRGYVILGPDGERTGAWGDVTRVALSKGRDKIALYHGENRRTVIAHPAGAPDDEFLRLRHEIERFLDSAG